MSFGSAIVRVVSLRSLKRSNRKQPIPTIVKPTDEIPLPTTTEKAPSIIPEDSSDSETKVVVTENKFNTDTEDLNTHLPVPTVCARDPPSYSTEPQTPPSSASSRCFAHFPTKKAHFRKRARRHSNQVSRCHLIVEQILHKVNELEYTLYEDQQQEFRLRMALEKQTDRVNDLRFSLDAEKQRNQRLVQLIRSVDASRMSDDEREQQTNEIRTSQWQSTVDSISPLLMQQRYDELTTSYKQCRRQLAKKNKLLTLSRCEKEEMQAKYDYLFDEYRNEQKRFEEICGKFLTLQFKKKQEMLSMREALTYASDCIISAQNILDNCEGIDKDYDKEFQQNLQYFIKALRHCSFLPFESKTPTTSFATSSRD